MTTSKFKNFYMTVKSAIAFYGDFESRTTSANIQLGKVTTQYQKHEPSGFFLHVVRFDKKERAHLVHGTECHRCLHGDHARSLSSWNQLWIWKRQMRPWVQQTRAMLLNLINFIVSGMHSRIKRNFELLTRKGVFPYDWFNDMGRLYKTQLPPKLVFDSSLITNTSPMRIMHTCGGCGRSSVGKPWKIITTCLSKRAPSNLQTYLSHSGT